MLEEIRQNEFRTNSWFAYNSIIRNPEIEEPTSQKFDSYTPKITQKTNEDLKEDTSSFDIIKTKNEVTITIEMPDIKDEDIDFKVTKDTIEIIPDHPAGKYHKIISLPCNVRPRTLTFTYRNGVLDIILQRGKKRSDRD